MTSNTDKSIKNDKNNEPVENNENADSCLHDMKILTATEIIGIKIESTDMGISIHISNDQITEMTKVALLTSLHLIPDNTIMEYIVSFMKDAITDERSK